MIPRREWTFKHYVVGIAILSLLVVIGISAGLAFLPHNKTVSFSTYRQIILIVLSIVAAALVLAETQRRNRVTFFLFILLGVQQILDFLYYFIPLAFPENKFAGHIYYQYVNGGFGLFIQSTCLVGCAVLMNTRVTTWLATTLVGTVFMVILAVELYPIFMNPKYLYTTPDITDFRIIDRAWVDVYHENGGKAAPEAVASRIGLSRWEGDTRTGELTHEEALQRVKEIEPYLFGHNHNMLIYKPLNEMWGRMNAFAGIAILLTILYWFFGGSPSGVYFERISVILLSFSVFEVFHFYTYANLTSYSDYLNYFNIGAFLSLLTVAMLVVVFFLRLRFLLSHEGRYYESRLARGPAHIARWRDGFDDYVIQKFFNGNPFKARFLLRIPRK
ncbi:MAG: hypothetical protein WEB37_08510 [Bacteroidota bacterium]